MLGLICTTWTMLMRFLTYTFNMGTQSPFGFLFIGAITTGAFVFVGVMLYIYLPKILKKSK